MPSDQFQSSVTIPEELKKKFPEIIELILGSESMNDEERQYWINILSVMTPEQVENLRQILQNEKDQLAAIDDKYQKEMEKLGKDKVDIGEMAKNRREKRDARTSSEGAHEDDEHEKEEAILRAISELE